MARYRYQQGRYRLSVTHSGGLEGQVISRLVDCWRSSYALMARRFNPAAATSIGLRLDDHYDGVAATMGSRIRISANYLRAHPWDSDVMTHEQFHVVQAYGSADYPEWAMEGLADYARWKYGLYHQQGGWSLPDCLPGQRHTDSYRVTARFFVWLERHGWPEFVQQLDRTLRAGVYSHSFWTNACGRTVEQLWNDYTAHSGAPI